MADARRMGKSELFSHFADRFEVKRTVAREFFEELTTLSEKELKRSGEFVLPGMVKLVVQKRKARMGRNPATGEAIKIPAKTVVKARIAKQIDPSGALPHELTRTRSFHYSIYTLDAAYHVADSAVCLGTDLYGAEVEGRSLRKATAYVAAYRGRQADWPYKEMKWPAEGLEDLLTRADAAWGPGAYPRMAGGDMILRYRIVAP